MEKYKPGVSQTTCYLMKMIIFQVKEKEIEATRRTKEVEGIALRITELEL